jgi:hypothetical protein
VSKCWILGHLRLTKEEMKKWEAVPVLYDEVLGFFIEPQWEEDGESGVMKVRIEKERGWREVKERGDADDRSALVSALA